MRTTRHSFPVEWRILWHLCILSFCSSALGFTFTPNTQTSASGVTYLSMSIPKKAERHWRTVERESTWRTEKGNEVSPLCIESSITFFMVVTNLHGHCFTDTKMAPAGAVSPHIGIPVMLGVTCCRPRAESGPLGATRSLVQVGSNQSCLESLPMSRKQNQFSLFYLSQRALHFWKLTYS